ncbi:MAG: NAD(P)-dependent oxidoreductase [Chloroflexota bacterium]|nr:NAD(P)-dependent oxidoreductase [Chloroflexota bacterium]
MRVLLLGATGFLGRHVNEALATEPEFEVVRHVHRASKDRDAMPLDLVDMDDRLADLVARAAPDAVVNCAGTTGDEARLEVLNVHLVERLLCAVRAAAPQARVVHLGSSAEYGKTPPGEPISEATPAGPLSSYGASKLAATRLVTTAADGGLDCLVLRVFNPIGAGMQTGSMPGNAARRLREAIASGSTSISLGPLDDWRDFLAASDVGGAVVAAVRLTGSGGPVINIGRGEAIQVRELVRRLAAIAGFRGEVREDSAPSARSAAVPWQLADTTLARSLLGWAARRPVNEALEELWRSTVRDDHGRAAL